MTKVALLENQIGNIERMLEASKNELVMERLTGAATAPYDLEDFIAYYEAVLRGLRISVYTRKGE